MIVASLTQGLTRATWVGDWDLGQERRAESAGRGEWAARHQLVVRWPVTRRGQISPDSRLWGLQTLDTDHTQSSAASGQWCNIVTSWGDAVTCDKHHNTVTPSLVTLGELFWTKQWLVKVVKTGILKFKRTVSFHSVNSESCRWLSEA